MVMVGLMVEEEVVGVEVEEHLVVVVEVVMVTMTTASAGGSAAVPWSSVAPQVAAGG